MRKRIAGFVGWITDFPRFLGKIARGVTKIVRRRLASMNLSGGILPRNLGGTVIGVTAIAAVVSVALVLITGQAWVVGVNLLIFVLFIAWWIHLGYRVIGAGDVKYIALLVRLGEPIKILSLGPAFVYRPVEDLWRIPTGKYWFDYEFEAHTKDGLWSKVVVRVDFNWPTPHPDDALRKFHFPRTGLTGTTNGRGLTFEEAKGKDPTTWDLEDSLFLLRRAYHRFPKEPMKATSEDLWLFFRGATIGSLISIMGELDRDDFVSKQEEVEAATRVMMLSGEGDPFFDCGIPAECLNIKIIHIEPLAGATKEALEAPRRAEREGEAQKIRAAKAKEAAPYEAETIKQLLAAHIGQKVSPTVAAFIERGGGRQGLDFNQLVTLNLLGAFQHRSPQSLAEAVALVDQMSPEERRQLRQQLEQRPTR